MALRPRERDGIVQALRAGVVPKLGLEHIQVGRAGEISELVKDIERIADGGSTIRFVIGEYGSGKTFFMNLARLVALEKGLVTMFADLAPDRRLHATGGQARGLYAELARNLSTRTKPDGGGLSNVVERFVSKAQQDALASDRSVDGIIAERLGHLEELTGGYDFAQVIRRYWQGFDTGDDQLRSAALRWLRGEFTTKTDARKALGVRTIVDDATRAIVIDELHTMLGTERGVQLQSLITRIELAIGRRPRRVGLSATLGDMRLASEALKRDDGSQVELIEARGGEAELRLQVLGHVQRGDKKAPPEADEVDDRSSPVQLISDHLFENLRGSDNLVFAGSRNRVEIYTDRLRQRCEAGNQPQEFFAHHANIAKEQRQFIEKRLKDGRLPTSAVCTSTLELGIDIGDVVSVAQIGAPFSVASLRQRLGRSGRRAGKPAILRQYVIESALDAGSHTADRLRLGLLRAVAMIELLLEGWCEPPRVGALHLSTLVHQILSVIASSGGARAETLYAILCERGPFKAVDHATFAQVLRSIGSQDVELIEQSTNGLLMLGAKGERLVEHYGFYAVFETSDEYRLIANGRELGTIPVDSVLAPGMMIIFSGRRWTVTEVRDSERVILITASKGGVPPVFGGDPGIIHDKVVVRMFELLEHDRVPVYLDAEAAALLGEARANYRSLHFERHGLARSGERGALLFTRRGTIATSTLALALRGAGFSVEIHDGIIDVSEAAADLSLVEALGKMSKGGSVNLFKADTNLRFDKFDRYLSDDLLQQNVLSSKLDAAALAQTACEVLQNQPVSIAASANFD